MTSLFLKKLCRLIQLTKTKEGHLNKRGLVVRFSFRIFFFIAFQI